MNPALAPRKARCWICDNIGSPEDVALRLFDEEGNRQIRGNANVVAYIESLGHHAPIGTQRGRADSHRKHIEKWLARGSMALAPISRDGTVVRVERDPEKWLDVQQQGMNVGMDAVRIVAERLPQMEDKDVIAVMKAGQTAAAKRADLETKGRQLNQIDGLIRLALGAPKDA